MTSPIFGSFDGKPWRRW